MQVFKSIFGRHIGLSTNRGNGNGSLICPGGYQTNNTASAQTATATAGAATLSTMSGKITSEALTTAAAAAYTLTLTNTLIAATDIVLFSVANGTNTQGVVVPGRATPGSGSVVILIENQHAAQALNGTLVISFLVIKGL